MINVDTATPAGGADNLLLLASAWARSALAANIFAHLPPLSSWQTAG